MITLISSVIVMRTFCSVERPPLSACVLSPGSFRSSRVCRRPHTLLCTHTNTHMYTHLGTFPPARCAMLHLAQRQCDTAGAAFARSLQNTHTHLLSCAEIKSTHTHLAPSPCNEWVARGMRELVWRGGGGLASQRLDEPEMSNQSQISTPSGENTSFINIYKNEPEHR